MKIEYYIFSLLVVVFTGCTSNKKNDIKCEVINDTISYTTLVGTNLSNDSTLWGMKVDFVINGRLFIQELSNDKLYGVYNVAGDKLIKEGSFLTKGNGPFEVVHPDLWGNENDSVLYISNYLGTVKEIFIMKVSDIYKKDCWRTIEFPDPQKSLFFPSVLMINDSICVVAGSELNSKSVLSRVDIKTGEISEIAGYAFPGFNLPSDIKVVEHMIYCDAQLLKHPTENKFVYGCKLGRYAEILELDADNRKLNRKIPLFSILPEYESINHQKKIKDNCLGGLIIRVTNNRIYCLQLPYTRKEERENPLYKGKPSYYADEIYIFDWEGKLLNKYRLDEPICNYGVDGVNDVIYGTTLNGEDFVVRRFPLR